MTSMPGSHFLTRPRGVFLQSLFLAFLAPFPVKGQPDATPGISIESSRSAAPHASRNSETIEIDLRPRTTPNPQPVSPPEPTTPPVTASASLQTTQSTESLTPTTIARARRSSTPKPRKETEQTAADTTATAGGNTTTESFSLSRYRTAPSEEIEAEIKRLRRSAEQLPAESRERKDLEDLIESHELRLRTGVPVQDLVAEITAKVSQIRGLKVKEPVRFRMMERKELKDLLEHHLEKDFPGESLENSEFIMKLLGAIPERVDLRKTIVSLLSEQIAGLYDPETKLLYVMKEFDLNRSLARIILAHEIGHALQDQHFNLLSLPIAQNFDSDLQLAAQSIIEGDATLLMQDYAAEALTIEKLPELLDAFLIDQRALDRAPYFLQRQLVFPYMGGADFLQSIVLQKGDKERDVVFRNYPLSTEQILHPDKFTTRDYDMPTTFSLPDVSAHLGDGWTSASSNVIGEFQIKTLFEAWREWEDAPHAADGWDGDRYVLYRKGDDFLLVWMSVWDTEGDAKDFFEFFSELMRTKRYKEHYADEDFPEGTHVRRLPLNPDAPAEKAPVHLRFRRDNKRVLVVMASSGEVIRQLEPLEKSLFDAVGTEKK